MHDDIRNMMPGSTQEIAEVVGDDNVMKLVEEYGGTRIFIPRNMGVQHKLAKLLGFENARILSNTFGGETLTVARCSNLLRYQRNKEICTKYDAGVGVRALARRYEVTERHIYSILSSG